MTVEKTDDSNQEDVRHEPFYNGVPLLSNLNLSGREGVGTLSEQDFHWRYSYDHEESEPASVDTLYQAQDPMEENALEKRIVNPGERCLSEGILLRSGRRLFDHGVDNIDQNEETPLYAFKRKLPW